MSYSAEGLPACSPAPRQGGIALVLVLWVISLLTTMAGAIAMTQRTESALAHNLLASRQGRALAEAGVYFGVLRLLEEQRHPAVKGLEDEEEVPWAADGVARDWAFGGARVAVSVVDEASRVDLNAASGELLEGLIEAAGIEEEEAVALRDAILDWRDPDDAHLLHGAEDDEYRAAGALVGAKDDEIETVGELLHVLGFTPELFAALEPALTVYSRKSTVNPIFAPPLVLSALPGMTPEEVAAYLELREQHRLDGTPAPLPPGVGGGLVNQQSGPVYRVRAEAHVPGASSSFAVEAVVEIGRGDNGYTFLAWSHLQGVGSDASRAEAVAANESEESGRN